MTGNGGVVVTAANALQRRGPPVTPFPVREGCTVEPLIEAAEMFPALERLALGARRDLWLAFRIFDPTTALHSLEAKKLGLADWRALIAHVAARGVTVRIMLADFEPVMADHLHAGSWRSLRALRALEAEQGRVQVIVVQHVGEIGWLWRQMLRWPLARKTRRLVEGLIAEDEAALADRPGLWRNVSWANDRPTGWRASAPPRLWPATYHHKFAVADGATAIIGGIDVNERRYDDRRHAQRADQTWHDVSCRVTGPIVGDIGGHFARLWNEERSRAEALAAWWSKGSPEAVTLGPTDAAEPPAMPGGRGPARLQLLRTRSAGNASALAFGPRAWLRELKAAHRLMFGAARRRLYVEAQFFRARDAAKWLAEALRATPELEVIVLVANVPEEVAFMGQGGNPAHRHGEYLQARALRQLVRAGGIDRVGLFSLARTATVAGKERDFAEDRGAAYGAGLIHIHAKVVIADDAAALVSSANINGRSFEWDTELGVLWQDDPAGIVAFRRALWQQLTHGTLDEKASLADWRELAFANAARDPEDRAGFVIPYQIGRARRFGRRFSFVPDDLV